MSINLTLICPVFSKLISLERILKDINLYKKKFLLSNFEIIIINDASPYLKDEQIKSLIKKFPNEIKVKYICLPNNLGVGAVRNLGISIAKTNKYIGFIDDDDFPNISNILDMASFFDVDIIISPVKKVKKNNFSFNEYRSNLSLFIFSLKGNLKTVAWNKLYNIDFIKSIPASFSTYRLFEDELYLLSILFSKNKKKFILIDKPFIEINKIKDSRSRSFSNKDVITFLLVQIENFKFLYRKSLFTSILWLLFLLPKSFLSFLISYLRSFFYKLMRYL